jgi:hypothetical protein
LSRQEEEQRQESVCEVFGENKLRNCGSMTERLVTRDDTYSVEFVTEVYGVNVVALQVREHDDLEMNGT